MKIGRYSGGVPNEALFAAYRESGIEVMELSVGNKQETHDNLPLADIQKWAGEYGIELWSYHLPFGWYNIATLDSAKRAKVIDLYAEMIKKARETVNDPRAIVMPVMSGFFTQRGLPAICPPSVRARQALMCGADLVIELPFSFSCAPSSRAACPWS